MTTDFLRRETVIELPGIGEFVPSSKFLVTPAGQDMEVEVVFAHISHKFLRAMEGVHSKDIPPMSLAIDTVVHPTTSQPLMQRMRAARWGVQLAHIYEMLKLQPRGETLRPNGQTGPLLNRRRIGTSFIVRRRNEMPWVFRLRYYEKESTRESFDAMGYASSGWVADEFSSASHDFVQQGGRVGYYL